MDNRSQELFFTDEWLECFCPIVEKIRIDHQESFLECYLVPISVAWLKTARTIEFTPFNAIIRHTDPLMSNSTRFNYELRLFNELRSLLHRWDAVNLKFKIDQLNMPRINDKRIISKNIYTEIIKSPIDIENLWNELSSENRNKILSAQKSSEIFELNNIEQIVDLIYLNHVYIKNLPSKEKLIILLNWAILNKHCKTFVCINNDKIISISVFMKSLDTVYYSFNYNDKTEQVRGRHLALIWEGIKWASESQCIFNFDGSQMENITKVFKTFNSKTIIYPNIYYIKNPILRSLQKLR